MQISIEKESSVKITSKPYLVMSGENVVAFYLDVTSIRTNRGYVDASSYTEEDFPTIYITDGSDEDDGYTEISFPDHKGWRFHSSSGGKTLAMCLVKC